MASLLDRFRPATKANRAQALVDPVLGMSTVSPRYKDYHSYLNAIKSPWVKACVGVIAYNAANVQYKLVRADAEEDDEQAEITASPLLDLLARPNPLQTGFQLLEAMWFDLELTGNCFIAMEALDGRGCPAELYRLRPDSVTVRPDPVRMVAGYVYTVGGKSIAYQPEEMFHVKYPNPLSDLYGMGTIEAGEARFDSELAMAEHERQFWRNGAKITGVLSTDNTVDDKVFARLTQTIRAFFRGSGYATLMLENGLKYQSVSDGPAKLGMLEMSKASRDMILAMFGVPPTKLGILENANYKAQASDEFFWTETIDPKLTRFEQELQRLVEVFHPGQRLRIAFDRLNFSDDLPTATVGKLLAETYSMTINEQREYRGKEGMGPEGDVILVPNTMTTLAQAVAPPAPVPAALDPHADPALDPATLIARRAAAKVLRVGGAAPATAAVVARHRDALLDAAGGAHAAKVADAFAAQERAVLAAVAGYKRRKAALRADDLFPADDPALGVAVKALHAAASEAAYQTADAVGLAVAFDLANPHLDAFLGALAARVVGIDDTTKAALDGQINEGLRRGYSTAQIAAGVEGEGYKGIAGVFAEAKGYRASLIARTETMAAYNGAALIAYKQAGVAQIEMLDGTDDPECAARNGRVIALDAAKSVQDHPNGTLCFVPIVAA